MIDHEIPLLIYSVHDHKMAIEIFNVNEQILNLKESKIPYCYQDGYTDIRGEFDYASIPTDQFIKATGHGFIVIECFKSRIEYTVQKIHCAA